MYNRERIWGRGGETGWIDIFDLKPFEDHEKIGNWNNENDAITGEALQGAAHLVIGEDDWRDYELKAGITPQKGGNVQILFRIDENQKGHYLVDFLLGWQAVAISRVDRSDDGMKLTKLSVVNHEIAHNREYRFELAVRGQSITTYINDKLVNQVTDATFEKGKISLSAWESQTKFRKPQFRILG